jgi:S1-C subfamily serine protease
MILIMVRRFTILFLLICGINGALFCQILYSASGVVDDVKRSCISIESIGISESTQAGEPTKLGSGVAVLKNGVRYFITNHHVLNPLTNKDILVVGLNLKSGKMYAKVKISAYDKNKDIAVLSWSGDYLINSSNIPDSIKENQASVGISMFADSASFHEGVGVITIGFPLGIGTEIAGNQPIIRSGIIAQSQRDFSHRWNCESW